MKTITAILAILLIAGAHALASPTVSLRVTGEESPCITWGIGELTKALKVAGYKISSTGSFTVEVSVNPSEVAKESRKAEGFKIVCTRNKACIVGFDAAGAMYGCKDLAKKLKETGKLPSSLDISDSPAMSIRSTSIQFMKRGLYDYPITPEEFPFFYDKKMWAEYLDFLVDNHFNAIAFWNGHPFAYFVELDKYPEAQDGMPPGQLEKNHDMLMWLAKEAQKRNIWLMFEFYQIHVPVDFAKAHNLPPHGISEPTPLLEEYTGYCIEKFVNEFPSVGLYICPGESLELKHQPHWINDVIFAAVKRTGKTPPIMIRSWAIDIEHMKQVAGNYPRLYTERKFNVEMLAGTKIDPGNADWAKITGDHVVNIHMVANLEPFRWSAPSYVQMCMQDALGHGATGIQLFARKPWRWPYGGDTVPKGQLQWHRDWMYFEAWSRYAWNADRDSKTESEHWLDRLAKYYGNRKAAEQMLRYYETQGDVLPAIQRLIWKEESNHSVLSSGLFLDQIKTAAGVPFLEYPEMIRIPAYIEALKKGQKLQGTTPIELLAKGAADAKAALKEAELAARSATSNKDEAGRHVTDGQAVVLVAQYYLNKVNATVAHALYQAGVDPKKNSADCLKHLEASLDDFRRLTALTSKTYDSISDVPIWNPVMWRASDWWKNSGPCPYHWSDLISLYEKELIDVQKQLVGDRDAKPMAASPTFASLQAEARKWEQHSPLKEQVYDHVQTLTGYYQKDIPSLGSVDAWKQRTANVRRELIRSLFGSDKLPPRTPLNAMTVGTVDYPDYTIDKVVYEAWPGVLVSAHLYLPKKTNADKLPCVLHIPGHYYQGKTQTAYGDDPSTPRHFCVGMVRNGIAVLVFDPMSQGERTPDGDVVELDHGRWFPILNGVSQMGLMVWESMRAIDYIQSRPEIDGKRIGVTGCSGGGENTPLTCAIDGRPVASVPVCYPTTYVQFMKTMRGLHWNSEVDICNNIPGVITYSDMSDWLACFAPKPQMFIAAKRDAQFPISASHEVARRLNEVYAAQSPGMFQFREFDAPHSYNKEMREAAYGFFLKHLAGSGDGSPVPEAPIELEKWDDAKLMCYKDGYRAAGAPLARLFRDTIAKSPEFSSVPEANRMREFQSKLRASIRKVCAVPAVGTEASVAESASVNGMSLKRVLLKPEAGITVPMLLSARDGAAPDKAVVIVSDTIKSDVVGSDFARGLIDSGLLVCVPDLRGIGESSSHRFEISTDLWMLGRTMMGEWIADIESTVKYLKGSAGVKDVCLVGMDTLAEAAILAAATVPEIDCLVSDGPLTSYWDLVSDQVRWDISAYIPGIMKHFDLPMVFAAIAPRRSVIINPAGSVDKDRLANVYKPAIDAYARTNARTALEIAPLTHLSAARVVSCFAGTE